MFKVIYLIILFLFFFPTISKAQNKHLQIIVIKIIYNENTVDLVINNNFYGGNISVKIPRKSNLEENEKIAKSTIEFLTSKKGCSKIGDGYDFIFLGGYPFWKNYQNDNYFYVTFTRAMIVNEKTIYVWGDIEREKNYQYSEKAGLLIPPWSKK